MSRSYSGDPTPSSHEERTTSVERSSVAGRATDHPFDRLVIGGVERIAAASGDDQIVRLVHLDTRPPRHLLAPGQVGCLQVAAEETRRSPIMGNRHIGQEVATDKAGNPQCLGVARIAVEHPVVGLLIGHDLIAVKPLHRRQIG